MVTIPQDIIDNIIEAIGDDAPLLEKCALVSSSFLLPSRKHLFSKLSLRSDHDCQRLHQFLVENPVVQSFVRSITIIEWDWNYYDLNRTSLIAILRLPFCCLESFSIDNWSNWSRPTLIWNDFHSELKDALSTVIHSSTLKTLCFDKVSVPIMVFLGVNLTKLELTDLSPNEFDGEQSRLLKPAASSSERVATTASHVDHCVWRNYSEPVHDRTEPIFLPFMCRLRVLEIYIDPCSATMTDFDILSFIICSLRVSLTSPATLEHIKFNITFKRTNNHFNYDAFFDDLRDADYWSHLDSIITHPTGSRLQRVDINIEYSFRYNNNGAEPDNTEVSGSVLDALPLLREKGILFVKAITIA